MRTLISSVALLVSLGAAHAASLAVPGSAQRGRALIQHYGCGACHAIPGVSGADANVGPPLTAIGSRVYIAGMLRNTPDNLARWIEHPQEIVPGNIMPDMGLTHKQAQDIAAYLLTLR